MDAAPLRLVVAGHVDHGKSTLVGRLLADTHALPEGKVEAIRAYCDRNAKPFEYAFLLDALRDERSQGITIESARIHFRSATRRYVILDAPGHIEFLRNMVTGAARADAAILVIDAVEGMRENSRRHGWLLSFLGVPQIVVAVNKMDLVGYDAAVFERIAEECRRFLEQVSVAAAAFVPVSAMRGDNLVRRSETMPWCAGPTLLEVLERFEANVSATGGPFRMPVQDIYRFSRHGDPRRIVAGTVLSGSLSPGDEVVFYPSNKRSFVASLEAFPGPAPERYGAGDAAGFTMTEQIYITRGELAAKAGERPPVVADRFRAEIFWLGRAPLEVGREYLLKIGTARCPMQTERIVRRLDAAVLEVKEGGNAVERNEAAECEVRTARPIAFDVVGVDERTSRFVIVDDFDICGGGVIREAMSGETSHPYRQVMARNYHWAAGRIDRDLRAERHGHRPHLVIVTGAKDAGKKAVARELESRLFAEGRLVFFMGIANLLYGMDADIKDMPGTRDEHMRRLGELANILLEAGHILIVTAIGLTDADRALIERSVPGDQIFVVWIGEEVPGAAGADLCFSAHVAREIAVGRIVEVLRDRGILFS